MNRLMSACLLVGFLATVRAGSAGHAARGDDHPPTAPRLVVMVVVDQLPYSFLEQYSRGLSADGIFHRIASQGASYRECRYQHAFTFTAPGHALLATGASPNASGIINNAWFDRDAGKIINCVADDAARVIGAADGLEGVSPRSLAAPTLDDQLKAWTGGAAKVFSVSFKDRGAVLLAGHAADGAFWFDYASGNWVTSDAYRDDLPGYVRVLNESRSSAQYAGKRWDLLLEHDRYLHVRPDDSPFERPLYGMSRSFPHELPSADHGDYYRHLVSSPFANDYTLLTAQEIIRHEGLGGDEIPDLIAISLSANDYIGHHFGPASLEVQDAFYRTDRQLGELARWLDQQVGDGRWVLAFSSDHGVDPIPEYLQSLGLEACRDPLGDLDQLQQRLEERLRAAFEKSHEGDHHASTAPAEPPYVLEVESNQVVLNARHPALGGDAFGEAQRIVRDELLTLPPVVAARTREDLLRGASRDRLGRMLFQAFHPGRSGDVLFVLAPHQLYPGKYSASHGSPWNYDTHVPLMLLGAGIRAGCHSRPVEPGMAVPTLARLLAIEPPAASTTDILFEAIEAESE